MACPTACNSLLLAPQGSSDSTNGADGNWWTQVDESGAELADGDATPITLAVDFWTRWVAITKADTNYLSLAEVQVFGF